ncbi:hypothetical protein [Aquabacterium sp.]|uniref:hypothetical protein n=1 Tax=Aquabacterium sp. TaxID=1872578 RepID=UPI003784000B
MAGPLGPRGPRRRAALLLCTLLLAAARTVAAEAEDRLTPLLEQALQRPAEAAAIRVQSSESPGGIVGGEAFGLLDTEFEAFRQALAQPPRWCEMLLLHLNNKSCSTAAEGGRVTLALGVVRRYDIPADQAFALEFRHQQVEASPRRFAARLEAANGPAGTRDIQIVLEAMPAPGGRTFARLSYSYGQGFMTATALRLYFATFGRSKVGFSEVGHLPNGQPELIGGIRGLVERNAMRYFLALQALFAADAQPQRARRWFELTEQHPRQLHEPSLEQYLANRPFGH